MNVGLSDFYAEKQMVPTKQANSLYMEIMRPTQNQIDFIIVEKLKVGSILCNTYPSVGVASDHMLLVAMLKLQLRVKSKTVKESRIYFTNQEMKEFTEEACIEIKRKKLLEVAISY